MSDYYMEKRDGNKPSPKNKITVKQIKGSLNNVEYFLNNFSKFSKCFKISRFFK